MKIIIIMFLVLIILPSVLSGTDEETDWFKFENDSLNSGHGTATLTPQNNPNFTAAKVGNFSVQFNGSNYYAGTNFNTTGFSSYSFAVWIWIDDVTADGQRIFEVSRVGGSTGWINYLGGVNTMRVRTKANAVGINVDMDVTGLSGQWVHFAGCSEDSALTHGWINGAEFNNGNHSNPLDDFTGDWSVGREVTVGTGFLTGRVDDLRIWFDYCIADAEVEKIYNAGTGSNDSLTILNLDVIFPRVNSSINDTTPKINEHILISANVTDETDLGDCVFSTNQTGGSDETIAVSGTADTCDQNFTISMGRNNVINYTILIDDGTNFNQSSHIITVANTLPNQAVIINATGENFNKNITINITPSIDADSDTLTYSWYINGSLVATGTTTTSIITNQTDGLYNVSVDVTDGVATIIGGSWFFTIDTTFPVLTITQPINNTIYVGDIPVDLTCNDNSLFRLNYTFTNGTTLLSVENNTAGLGEMKILDTINGSAFADNTNYLLIIECADTHTKKKIKDYQVIKDETKKELKFRTDKQKVIYIESENKQDVTFFFSYKDNDRYKFNYYFDNPLGTYSFRLRAESLIYLPNSKYNAHFITRENWIDFNLDDKKAVYKITKIYDNEYRIEITTELSGLEFDSIGDLNIVTSQLNLSINNTPVSVFRTPLPLETPINIAAMVVLIFIIVILFNTITGGRKK